MVTRFAARKLLRYVSHCGISAPLCFKHAIPCTSMSFLNAAYTDDASGRFTTSVHHSTAQDLSFITDPIDLMRLIHDEHAKNGKSFILPWGDADVIHISAVAFKHLLEEGVLPEFLFDACIKREELFTAFTKSGTHFLRIIQLLVDIAGITYENAIRFIAEWTEELHNVTPESVHQRITVFLSRGILSGEQILRVIRKCPQLLFARDSQKMEESLEMLSDFFPPVELRSIMLSSPQVALQESNELVLRFEYIYFHMAIEPQDFTKCISWHELSLEEIMARHEVLRRTGKYSTPDPKRPQLQIENPSMHHIFDTNDAEFATSVAGIQKEEWIIFREVFKKMRLREDTDRPYERVKPSMRKAFERKRAAERAKEAKNNLEEYY